MKTVVVSAAVNGVAGTYFEKTGNDKFFACFSIVGNGQVTLTVGTQPRGVLRSGQVFTDGKKLGSVRFENSGTEAISVQFETSDEEIKVTPSVTPSPSRVPIDGDNFEMGPTIRLEFTEQTGMTGSIDVDAIRGPRAGLRRVGIRFHNQSASVTLNLSSLIPGATVLPWEMFETLAPGEKSIIYPTDARIRVENPSAVATVILGFLQICENILTP